MTALNIMLRGEIQKPVNKLKVSASQGLICMTCKLLGVHSYENYENGHAFQ